MGNGGGAFAIGLPVRCQGHPCGGLYRGQSRSHSIGEACWSLQRSLWRGEKGGLGMCRLHGSEKAGPRGQGGGQVQRPLGGGGDSLTSSAAVW